MPFFRALACVVGCAACTAHTQGMSAASLRKSDSHVLTPETVILDMPLAPGEEPLRVSLRQMMAIFKVPGFSIALIDHDRIAWAQGYGVTEPSGSVPVTPATLFQAASVSKPITAAGGLWLVEHGKLGLDEDINTRLKTWKVPETALTATRKVTLRQLMSHNAGFNVHGFAGYDVGASIPTITQTLDGLPPANNPPIRVTAEPGSICRYSGGGVTVEGLLIADASGQSFEDFMRQRVLLPAGMTDSSFHQELSPAQAARAATGARSDGNAVPGKWHVYPELAPDGLWTTPSDLAKFAIEIARSAHGQANHVLSQRMTQEMLKVQCNDSNDRVGLGFGVGFSDNPDLFRHTGGNDGFGSILMMLADSGNGLAAMGNSDAFESVAGWTIDTLAKSYGWHYKPFPHDLGDLLVVAQSLRGAQAALDAYAHVKALDFAGWRHDSSTLNKLGYRLLGEKKLDEAIKVLALNVVEYPQDANTYDSLGEAYMDAGQKELAIRNYEQSLELNPANDNAVKRLATLRGQD